MKRFIVIETSKKKYYNMKFEINTQIKQNVVLPFTSNKYRCVMFDGNRVHLTLDDDVIIGQLV